MSFKSCVAEGLLGCLARKRTQDNFSDFTVVVEDQEFHCHKFILSACSTFFDGLLRNEMRENLENRAVLTYMSKETFAVIMNAVYKGENCLTSENILLVWETTCFLDIPFLIDLCERFVSEHISLNNYEVYNEYARLLGSKSVVARLHEFMTHNFQEIKATKTFFELSADELCIMLDSDLLKVDSEDVVIEAILQWINGGQDNSKGLIDETPDNSCVDQSASSQRNEPANKLNNDDKIDIDTNEQSSEQGKYSGANRQLSEYNNDIITEETLNKLPSADEIDIKSKELPGISKLNKISINISKSFYTGQTQTQLMKDAKLSEHIIEKRKTREVNLNDISYRESSILKLLKSARMFLVSRGCLEKLARNSVIKSNPDAMSDVFDALLYKCKAVNYRHTILRYRECSNVVNGVAFLSDYSIIFYDLLRNCEYVLCDLKTKGEELPGFVGLTALGSDLCLTTKKFEHVSIQRYSKCRNNTIKEFLYFKLYNMQEDSVTGVVLIPDTCTTFLLNDCESVTCVGCFKNGLTIFKEFFLGLDFVHSVISPTHTTIIEDMILIFYESMASTGIKVCKPGNKKIVSLPGIRGPAENMTSFRNGKYLYLIQKNGNLWLVTRSQTDDIEFTFIDTLWDFDWDLHGAVCYNKTLFIFGKEIKVDNYIVDLQKRSLPDVFDNIKAININCMSQVVHVAVNKSILKCRRVK